LTRERINQQLIVIGYGSLLSGYGLLAARRGARAANRRLIARRAFPVILENARRGLAKPSSHGDYLAMDLEPIDRTRPIRGRIATARKDGEGIGALGLEFAISAAPMIARREEYDPNRFLALIERADAAEALLGDYLYRIAERVGFDLLAYRTALRAELGYTSPGYIFHPLPLEDGRVAIVAIGSGFEGSGDPAVRSRRSETGMDRLLTMGEALAVRSLALDREGQLGYFVECALGGCHGIEVGDLLEAFDGRADGWRPRFAAMLRSAAGEERARFLEATSLDEETYRRSFGAPNASLMRLIAEADA
jgi:hypothetical protein